MQLFREHGGGGLCDGRRNRSTTYGHGETTALFVAFSGGQLLRWKPSGSLDDLKVPSEIVGITDLQVTKDGQCLAVHGDKGPLAIWSGNKWLTRPLPDKAVTALSSSGTRYAIKGAAGGVDIFDLTGKKVSSLLVPQMDFGLERIRFALSDTRVVGVVRALLSSDVVVWDATGGKPIREGGLPEELPLEIADPKPGELWPVVSENETFMVNLTNGRTIASVPGRDIFAEGLGAAGPTAFAFSLLAGLGASAAVGPGELRSDYQPSFRSGI